jgi:hypothetical protein
MRAMYHIVVVGIGDHYTIADKNQVLNDASKAVSLSPNMWQAYLLRGGLNAYFGDEKSGCEDVTNAIEKGGVVSKKVKDYICNGKGNLADVYVEFGKAYSDFIPLNPELIVH